MRPWASHPYASYPPGGSCEPYRRVSYPALQVGTSARWQERSPMQRAGVPSCPRASSSRHQDVQSSPLQLHRAFVHSWLPQFTVDMQQQRLLGRAYHELRGLDERHLPHLHVRPAHDARNGQEKSWQRDPPDQADIQLPIGGIRVRGKAIAASGGRAVAHLDNNNVPAFVKPSCGNIEEQWLELEECLHDEHEVRQKPSQMLHPVPGFDDGRGEPESDTVDEPLSRDPAGIEATGAGGHEPRDGVQRVVSEETQQLGEIVPRTDRD